MRDLLRHVRRNHALEHGTVAVLLERGARPPLGGYSTPGGFFIFGGLTLESVSDAAREALGRMREGERDLAISPFCGTNLVTRALLTGLVTALIMGKKQRRLRRMPALAAGMIAAAVVSRPLGNALQRRYTTLAEPVGQEIVDVRRVWAGPFTVHRVRITFNGE
jgi:hypothetical protein